MKCPVCGMHACTELQAEIAEADAVVAAADAGVTAAEIEDLLYKHQVIQDERGWDGWNILYKVWCRECGELDENEADGHQAAIITEKYTLKGRLN